MPNAFDQFDTPTKVSNPFDQFDAGAKPDDTGDFMRGAKVAVGQTVPILKGVVGLAGATAEKAVGEGGIATGIKNWGLNGFNEGMQKLAPLQRDTDELTTSWDRAKQGDLGALVDWVQYGLGYAAGQALEAGATAIVGGLIGGAAGGVGAAPGAVAGVVAKGAVKDAALSMVQRAVAKESQRLIAEAAAQGTKLEAKAAVQAATRTVASNIGSTSALLAYGGAQELGSIYPEAEAEAAKRGEKLSGSDLARVWASGIAAGGIEGLTDKLGINIALGKVKLPGAPTRIGSGVRAGLGGVAVEGLTEGVQTGIERVGAGQEVFSDEGIKDIINSAGQGALGGAAIGGGLGLIHPNLTPRDRVVQHNADMAMDELAGATTIDEAIDAAQRAVPPLTIPQGFDGDAALTRLDAQNNADVKGLKTYGKGYGDVPYSPIPVARQPEKPGAVASESEVVDSPFSDRLLDVRSLIDQPRVRQQVRDTLGPDALGDLLYYAQKADDASLPGRTSDRMLQVAEALLTRAQVTQLPTVAPSPTAAPAPAAGPGLPAPTRPLAIGLDTTPTGTMRVDSSGNAAPEVRADVVSLRDRARAMAERRNGLTASVPRGGEPGAGVMVGEGTLTTPTRPVAETRALPGPVVDDLAHNAAPSPQNDHPDPTDGQKEAGNYRKGHVRMSGLDISIENPVGSERKGVSKSGKAWSTTMQHHYGYIRGTVGMDKEHIDTFIKPGTRLDYAGPVFVVDQTHPESGKPDEHKVMLGFDTLDEARAAYAANYDRNWKGLGNISETSMPGFKEWLASGDTKKPFGKTTLPVENGVDSIPPSETKTASASESSASTDIATLQREWQAAAKAGNTDLARSINDRIVAAKKGLTTPRSDSNQSAFEGDPEVTAALEKLGMRNAEARGGQRWFMPSEGGLGLGDLYVDFAPDGEATISAHYSGKEMDSRKARGAAAISAAVERARDGIQAARLKIAQRELAKEQPGLPAPTTPAPLKDRVAAVKARSKGDDSKSAAEWANDMAALRRVKPRPLNKLYGPNPTPAQIESHATAMREWNAQYRKASAEQKKALVRDNKAFAERQAAGQAEAAKPAEAAAPTPLPEPTAEQKEPATDDWFKREGISTMPAAEVMPAPTKMVTAADLSAQGLVSQAEAKKRIAAWKAEALRIGKTGVNKNKIVFSLFDRTGEWSQPYVDAGYDVRRYDIANGDDLMAFFPIADIMEARKSDKEVVGVLAAPPCTSFSSSGARWWSDRHDKPNEEWLEKTYGAWATTFFDTPLDYANTLVAITQAFIEFANPTQFHSMENPVGRIAEQNDLPKPLLGFDPSNFGDPYTKRTFLWGSFNTDLPTANVKATDGSKIASMSSGNLARSETPEGFAYSFFMANHGATATKPHAVEQVAADDKGAGRLRADKRIKEFLSAKRPADDDTQRITDYRTQTTIGYNEAVDAGVDADVLAFLRGENEWAMDRLKELAPEVHKRFAPAEPQHLEGKTAEPATAPAGKPRLGESADEVWRAIKRENGGVVVDGKILYPTLRVVGGDDFIMAADGSLRVVDKKSGGMTARDATDAETAEFHRDLERDGVQALILAAPGYGSGYKRDRKVLRELHSPSGNSFESKTKPAPAPEQDRQGLRAEDRRLRDLDSAASELAAQLANDMLDGQYATPTDRADIAPGLRMVAEQSKVPSDDLRQAVLKRLAADERLTKRQTKQLVDALNPAKAAVSTATGKIDDFGEELKGAKKDYAAELKDALGVDVAAEPLSKSWPDPDYQKLIDGGADPRAVAMARSMRDEIPTKPQRSWKLKGWVDQVKVLRDFAQKMLGGEVDYDTLRDKINAQPSLRDNIAGRADLYEAVGHEHSLKGIHFSEHHYSLYRGEKNVRKWVVEQAAKATSFSNWPRELAVADTRDEALSQFKAKLGTLDLGAKAKKQPQFVIYRTRGQEGAWIGKKIGREYINLKRFDDVKAAREFLEKNTADLEALLAKYKDTPLERREDNQPRVGDDHRGSAPVTPKVFSETFGFRGVQFGNYVEQGRRQSDLNQTYDSLMDLAAVLGVAPRALSLNGELGLAFGARGNGGKGAPAAHYEPGNIVINLTKGSGPGTLAHEWWHAADNYFSRRGKGTGFGSAGSVANLREPLQRAFSAVKIAVGTKEMQQRFAELDKRRSKPYWNTPHERSARAFEAYIISKLQDQSQANDYLANVVDQQVWDTAESMRAEMFGGTNKPTYPYPTADEMPAVRAAFDDFWKVVEQQPDENGGVILNAISAFNEVSNPDNNAARLPDSITQIKTGAEAIDWLIANMKDQGGRTIAERLRPYIGDGVSMNWVKAGDTLAPENAEVVRRLGGNAAMLANLRADGKVDVWAHTGKSMDESLLLHELIHAATMRALQGTKNAMLRADLQNIVAAVQRSLRDVEFTDAIHVDERKAAAFFARVVDNEDELLAYAFSSPTLRRFMQNMNAQGKFIRDDRRVEVLRDKAESREALVNEPTLWQKFVDAIRSALGFSKMYAKRFEAALADRAGRIEAFVNAGKDSSLYERLDTLLQQAMDANDSTPADSKLTDTKPAKISEGAESVMAAVRGFDQKAARNAWLDLTTDYKSTGPFNALNTQYAKAQKNPTTFGRVFDAVQDYIKDISTFANAAADLAPNILPKLDSLRDVLQGGIWRHGADPADLKATGAALWKGTLEDQRVYNDGELAALGLNAAQRGLYHEARAAIDQSLDDLGRTEVVRLAGPAGAPVAAQASMQSTMADAAAVLTAHLREVGDVTTAALIDEKVAQVQKLKADGYAPLMRFGRHTLHITRDGETQFFGMYESNREANEAARKMAADPDFAGAQFKRGLMSEKAFELFQGMNLDALELFAKVTGAEDNQAYQDFLKLTKNNRSAMKRMIHREGIAGFSEDTSRVLAAFVTSNARAASGNMHMGRATQAANDIPKEMGDLKDDAIKLVKYVQNPTEEAAAIRGLLFTNFIGGSVASAAVNLTQPFTMTLPYLSQYGGPVKAAGHILAAARVAASGGGSDQVMSALKRAERDGIVSPQEIHHLQAEAMGRARNPFVKKALFVWGSMFSLSEQFNRRVSFIAAYNTALEHGMDNPFKFAEKAVIETQGLYNKGNKPNAARGAIGATVMTFKQFGIHYLEFLGRMWRSGPEGKKAVGTALAILMLTAGAGGLPFADDLDDLIDTAMQALGYNFNSKKAKRKFIAETLGLGEGAAEFLTRGVSGLAGMPIDVSVRMGMGNLLPGTGALLKSNTDRSRDVLEFAGAAGGLAKSAMDSGTAALQGDLAKAGMGMAPLAVQNIAKAAEMWNTGEYRNQKGQKVISTGPVDAAMKFIGFQPSEVARQSAAQGEVLRGIQLAKNVESEIAAKWAQGLNDNRPELVSEARQELAEWNSKNPETPMRLTMQQIIGRVREMRLSRAERTIKSAPREMRQAVREGLAQ